MSGSTKPSQANEEAFNRAVDEVADVTTRLLDSLVTSAPPKNREVEAAKLRERAAKRYAAADPLLLDGIPRRRVRDADRGAVLRADAQRPRRRTSSRSSPRAVTRPAGFRPFASNGESAFFHALNRGKRSAVLSPPVTRQLAEPRGRRHRERRPSAPPDSGPARHARAARVVLDHRAGHRSRRDARWTRACRRRWG